MMMCRASNMVTVNPGMAFTETLAQRGIDLDVRQFHRATVALGLSPKPLGQETGHGSPDDMGGDHERVPAGRLLTCRSLEPKCRHQPKVAQGPYE